jgi:hypothetical protein
MTTVNKLAQKCVKLTVMKRPYVSKTSVIIHATAVLGSITTKRLALVSTMILVKMAVMIPVGTMLTTRQMFTRLTIIPVSILQPHH